MAAPVANGAPAAAPAGPVNDQDIELWKNKFNEVLAKPSEHINSKSPADAREWQSGFFGCCNPIDTCLITWCLPCVTFGKTFHRTHKSATMEGYEPINTTCLLFLASSCFALHWIPTSIMTAELRRKYHLQGNCIEDIAKSCCCALCQLVQNEKESIVREKELGGGSATQYENESMVYAPKA